MTTWIRRVQRRINAAHTWTRIGAAIVLLNPMLWWVLSFAGQVDFGTASLLVMHLVGGVAILAWGLYQEAKRKRSIAAVTGGIPAVARVITTRDPDGVGNLGPEVSTATLVLQPIDGGADVIIRRRGFEAKHRKALAGTALPAWFLADDPDSAVIGLPTFVNKTHPSVLALMDHVKKANEAAWGAGVNDMPPPSPHS